MCGGPFANCASELNTSILENYTEEDFEMLCERADFYGMDALTEDEQYVVDNWSKYINS